MPATPVEQLPLGFVGPPAKAEDPAYYAQQLITCIGNKRALLGPIAAAVQHVKRRLGRDKLRLLDAFAGSGVVSRLFKAHASRLVSNDLEAFAVAAARSHLANHGGINVRELDDVVEDVRSRLDSAAFEPGFIEELYAPRDERHITADDRVFYTKRNARRLDNYRRLLTSIPESYAQLLMGPLLSEASVHANTAGVFKGFYKDRRTGIGKFGGTHGDALKRILGDIEVRAPILSRYECDVELYQEDANCLVHRLAGFDLVYFDPPYNQHPYGSNYFLLNLLVSYRRPTAISRVSGIPEDWQRSAYNVRSRSLPSLHDLIASVDATFILLSFNDEGFVARRDILRLLRQIGRVRTFEYEYNTFRGSRNLNNRSTYVTEQLFLVERA